LHIQCCKQNERRASHHPKKGKCLIQNVESMGIEFFKPQARRTICARGKLLQQPVDHLSKIPKHQKKASHHDSISKWRKDKKKKKSDNSWRYKKHITFDENECCHAHIPRHTCKKPFGRNRSESINLF